MTRRALRATPCAHPVRASSLPRQHQGDEKTMAGLFPDEIEQGLTQRRRSLLGEGVPDDIGPGDAAGEHGEALHVLMRRGGEGGFGDEEDGAGRR